MGFFLAPSPPRKLFHNRYIVINSCLLFKIPFVVLGTKQRILLVNVTFFLVKIAT